MNPVAKPSEAGMALIAVMLVLATLMALGAALTTAVTMDTGLRGAFDRTTTGFYAAESGLNRGMGDFRNKFLNFQVPTGSDFAPHTFTLGRRTVSYQLNDVPGNPQLVTIPAGQVFGGLNSIQYTYTASSQAIYGENTEADVGAEFDVSYIPLFQFIAFYAKDLEILPGADMHLHGRVHTNGDLYLNSDAHLWIEDNQGSAVPLALRITTVQVTSKGDIYRGRKNNSSCGGLVTVDKLEDRLSPKPDLDPKDLSCDGGSSKVSAATLSQWKGSIVSHVESISVPEPDIIAKGAGAFWRNADLRIVLRLDQAAPAPFPAGLFAVEAQDADGNRDAAKTALLQQFMEDDGYNAAFSSLKTTRPIFYTDVPTSGGACTCSNANPACTNNVRTCYVPAIPTSDARVYATNMTGDLDYRRGGFYNWREGKWMLLFNVNIHDLLDWNMRQGAGGQFFDPGDATDGGLVIYITVQGAASAGINNYGVRIFGSASLPFPATPPGGDPTGLTLVSDQPMYVLGNYNSVAPWQPAAVIGDNINLLSTNYFNTTGAGNDSQSPRSLTDASRDATPTTINSAFLAGVDTTTWSNYNGGLENYPRFHEDWTGQNLNYRGSFVSLGTPDHVNGPWCGTGGSSVSGCNIYVPPNRNYDYEPAFNDVRNLPPLTPRFVYVQQVLFTENFK
jgi:hypothetical protein